MESVKCIIVGDKMVGKSVLWSSFITNTYYDGPIPTIFDHPRNTVMIDRKPINIILLDTVSKDGYERLRILAYSTANVSLICFSLVNVDSFENVKKKWYPELRQSRPKIPIVLVGTKLDLRENEEAIGDEKKLTSITYQQGVSMAEEIRAVKYVECSALTQKGLNNVFDEAVRAALIGLKESNKLHLCLIA